MVMLGMFPIMEATRSFRWNFRQMDRASAVPPFGGFPVGPPETHQEKQKGGPKGASLLEPER